MTMAIQARGSSIAVCCNVLVNIVFNQVSPIAFAHVGWKYYSLFLCTNAIGAVVVFLIFPETKGKSLEEISAIFVMRLLIQICQPLKIRCWSRVKRNKLSTTEERSKHRQLKERRVMRRSERGSILNFTVMTAEEWNRQDLVDMYWENTTLQQERVTGYGTYFKHLLTIRWPTEASIAVAGHCWAPPRLTSPS